MYFIIAQVSSGIATLFMAIAQFQKNKKLTLGFNCFVNVFTALAYLFLRRYVGIWIVLGGLVRLIIFAFWENGSTKWKSVVATLFTIYFIVITVVFWQDAKDLFVLVNYSMMTYAFALCNNKSLRIFYLISIALLTPYNILVKAYTELAKLSIQLISCIIGITLIVNREKKEKDKKFENK